MEKFPSIRCWCFSGALNPALSSISLLASSLTYSDEAPPDRLTMVFIARVLPSDIFFCTCCIMYACTSGLCSILEADTRLETPLYPASFDASVMVHPLATIVSTSSLALLLIAMILR